MTTTRTAPALTIYDPKLGTVRIATEAEVAKFRAAEAASRANGKDLVKKAAAAGMFAADPESF